MNLTLSKTDHKMTTDARITAFFLFATLAAMCACLLRIGSEIHALNDSLAPLPTHSHVEFRTGQSAVHPLLVETF